MLAPDALALPSDVQFRTAIFFEGLPRDATLAKRELGGTHIERLLLVSGQSGSSWGHDLFAKSLTGTSIAAKHVHVKNNGHFFTPAVNDGIRNEIEWIAPWKPMT